MAPSPPFDFALVGLSHKTAPVEVREKLAAGTDLPALLARLKALEGVEELVLVSTCNRVEALVWCSLEGAQRIHAALLETTGPEGREALYLLRGEAAITHLFRVASSLDSMILGEPQILGQVKDAFTASQKAGVSGPRVNQACQTAFAAAKRVRSETAIGSEPVSMASAAVQLARKIFGGLEGRTVLLVGAGKMSELAAKHLTFDDSRILVTNRTFERGADLAARVGGTARPYEELPALLGEADIVVSSTAAPRPIITAAMMHSVVKARRYRPLFLVDLAVPRDIEPEVGRIENVYAYDVDDLSSVVEEGLQAREAEAQKARAILEEEVSLFLQARQVREVMPVIAQLRLHAEEIARAEADKTLALFGEDLTPKQRKSIEAMGRAIVNKLLHAPTQRMREASGGSPDEAAALALQIAQLFDLDQKQPRRATAAPAPRAAPEGPAGAEATARERLEPTT